MQYAVTCVMEGRTLLFTYPAETRLGTADIVSEGQVKWTNNGSTFHPTYDPFITVLINLPSSEYKNSHGNRKHSTSYHIIAAESTTPYLIYHLPPAQTLSRDTTVRTKLIK
jgi:hypothetical protein